MSPFLSFRFSPFYLPRRKKRTYFFRLIFVNKSVSQPVAWLPGEVFVEEPVTFCRTNYLVLPRFTQWLKPLSPFLPTMAVFFTPFYLVEKYSVIFNVFQLTISDSSVANVVWTKVACFYWPLQQLVLSPNYITFADRTDDENMLISNRIYHRISHSIAPDKFNSAQETTDETSFGSFETL